VIPQWQSESSSGRRRRSSHDNTHFVPILLPDPPSAPLLPPLLAVAVDSDRSSRGDDDDCRLTDGDGDDADEGGGLSRRSCRLNRSMPVLFPRGLVVGAARVGSKASKPGKGHD